MQSWYRGVADVAVVLSVTPPHDEQNPGSTGYTIAGSTTRREAGGRAEHADAACCSTLLAVSV